MNNRFAQASTQRGMALVIALLLLLVLTVLGITSMSGSLMQERMAGNVNLQTLAFEGASAGVSDSLEFGLDSANWGGAEACSRGSEGWVAPWSGFTAVPVPGLSNDLVVEYRRRIGCFEPEDIPPHWEEPGYSIPTQLLVLNQGQVRRASDEQILAMREVEVRVENRGGDSQCAIRIEGGLGEINIGGGGPAVDGGEGGCPISLSPGGGADDLKEAVGSNHVGNYQPDPPGIAESEGHEPWNDGVQFAWVVNELKTAVQAYESFMDFGGASQADWRCYLGDRIAGVPVDGDGRLDPDQLDLDFDWPVDLQAPLVPELPLAGCVPDPSVDPVDDAYAELFVRMLHFVESRSNSWDVENCKGTFYEGSTRIGSGNVGQCGVEWGTNNPNQRWRNTGAIVGDPDDPLHITYVAGHLGNPGNSNGSGILVLEGGNCWDGGAYFQGLQLIAGGHFQISGGGGGETTGSIVMTLLQEKYGSPDTPNFWNKYGSGELYLTPFLDPDSADHAESGLFFAGGGNHSIEFSCGGDGEEFGHTEYMEKINQCLETELDPNCDPEGFGMRKAIASWREYVDRQRWPND